MAYPLESLNDEKFQQLCQALLVRGNPGVQCFPIGQPDGGRDAISREMIANTGKFLVYQVKFVRNPASIENPRKWLMETMQGEIEKVRALVDRSAIGYFLLTNVPGSGHLDAGSIDKMNSLLQQWLDLPSICWWRDDIERRLDDAWAIKWAYPEVMTGPDFLRAIFESGIRADLGRREAALRAFLRDQFTRDSEVKFRQVDLQNRLLDLFVDVPVGSGRHFRDQAQAEFFNTCAAATAADEQFEGVVHRVPARDIGYYEFEAEAYSVGAASFLLSVSSDTSFRNTVLEGAPGQGKSTISQYLCQVHRIRLLNEKADQQRISKAHFNAPVRLPIRVDLRDLAMWMRQENPFTRGDRSQFAVPWKGQLEPFLSALISFHAGGQNFSVEDLVAVLQVSSVCLVFDGLDEVADVETRKVVVDELVSGTQRLAQNAAALQVVVTSRPAAFLNSPGMPEKHFRYLTLQSLTTELIKKYFGLWARARNVTGDIMEELGGFISSKLDQPHIRQLARNPMQLAILLSLLYTRGAALPEKRTALYDAYIEHFFNREAEKSISVRAHRDVLLEIHRYLAWVMHSEAERKGGRDGSLSHERLLDLVETYLRREDRDPSLAKQLFEGMERVVVLVSRTQGLVEFEVQPLREYFAARYLFETAPLSSPGHERSGSRPDRFEVIARSSYWLNVARFYAGCYSKGEIPSLVQSLRDLCNEQGLVKLTNHPRGLAAALLSDWVFAQIPRSISDVIGLITEENGFFRLLAELRDARPRLSETAALTLSDQCGSQALVDRCYELLHDSPGVDYSVALLSMMRGNAEISSRVRADWFQRTKGLTGDDLTRLLHYGRVMGTLEDLEASDISSLALACDARHITELYLAGRADILEAREDLFDTTVSLLLTGRLEWSPRVDSKSSVGFLGWVLRPETYFHALLSRQPTSMMAAIRSMGMKSLPENRGSIRQKSELFATLESVVFQQLELPVREWAGSLRPWRTLIDTLTENWGELRAGRLLATVAAGVKSGGRARSASSDLFALNQSLCDRARYARLAARDVDYWTTQFEGATNVEDRVFLLIFCFAWCPLSTIVRLVDKLNAAFESLPSGDWYWINSRLRRTRVRCGLAERDPGTLIELMPGKMATRTACALAEVADEGLRKQVITRYLEESPSDDKAVQTLRMWLGLQFDRIINGEWQPNIELVSKAYRSGVYARGWDRYGYQGRRKRGYLSLEAAQEVLGAPRLYPTELVRNAEMSLRRKTAKASPTVAAIAEAQGWFADEARIRSM